jgi:hypothetical protein
MILHLDFALNTCEDYTSRKNVEAIRNASWTKDERKGT